MIGLFLRNVTVVDILVVNLIFSTCGIFVFVNIAENQDNMLFI